MASTRREFVFSAEASGYEQTVDRMGNSLSSAFKDANKELETLLKNLESLAGNMENLGTGGQGFSPMSKNMAQVNEDREMNNRMNMLYYHGEQRRVDDNRRQTDRVVHSSGSDGDNRQGVGTTAKNAGKGAIVGGLGALGLMSLFSVSGFVGKLLSEGIALDEALGSVSGLGVGTGVSGSGYGKNQAEMLSYLRNYALASGDAGLAGSSVTRNLALEKGFSLDEGQLFGLQRGLRTEGQGRSATDVTLEMLNIFKKSDLFNVGKGDFTQLSEKIEFLTQMTEEAGRQMESSNATYNAQIIASLGSAGFGDQRMMDVISSANQAIRSPQNDFTQAFLFRSLRRANPESSLYDILKQQQSGIYGQGTLNQILGDVNGAFSGDLAYMNLAEMLGLEYWQAEKLMKGYRDNPAASQNLLETMTASGGEAIQLGSGTGHAGVMSRRMAQLEDWFASKGIKALDKLDEWITAFENEGMGGVGKLMAQEVGDAIENAMNNAISKLNEKFGESLHQLLWESPMTEALRQLIPGMDEVLTSKEEEAERHKERVAMENLVESTLLGGTDIRDWLIANPSSTPYGFDADGNPLMSTNAISKLGSGQALADLMYGLMMNESAERLIRPYSSIGAEVPEKNQSIYEAEMFGKGSSYVSGQPYPASMTGEESLALLQELVNLVQSGMAFKEAVNQVYTSKYSYQGWESIYE